MDAREEDRKMCWW